ncbi:MAG: cell division septal protein [Gaiellaceae bacterium]|nr:cell division septal protein [Gaiellaceae bacterium]
MLLLAAGGAYGVARGTSAFAVDAVAVHGAAPEVGASVREAIAHVEGRSLLALDLPALERAIEAVPAVASARVDRGFPSTLNVHVTPELPVAVVRQGSAAWLVAASGRVIAPLDRGARPRLPRIWLPRGTELAAGSTLTAAPLRAARAVAPLPGGTLPPVATVRAGGQELTLVLRTGVEVRLGDLSDRLLKLTVAARILPSVEGPDGYVDVSVPERPVASATLDSQVEVELGGSTDA